MEPEGKHGLVMRPSQEIALLRWIATSRGEARRVIAADGYMLAPGFIDIHCHSDFSLFDHPEADIKLRQGVTLEV